MFTALSTGQWTGVVFDLLLADYFRQFFFKLAIEHVCIELLFKVVLCRSSPL